jgi:hypothetical protein
MAKYKFVASGNVYDVDLGAAGPTQRENYEFRIANGEMVLVDEPKKPAAKKAAQPVVVADGE